jgi:hypothetical protein
MDPDMILLQPRDILYDAQCAKTKKEGTFKKIKDGFEIETSSKKITFPFLNWRGDVKKMKDGRVELFYRHNQLLRIVQNKNIIYRPT